MANQIKDWNEERKDLIAVLKQHAQAMTDVLSTLHCNVYLETMQISNYWVLKLWLTTNNVSPYKDNATYRFSSIQLLNYTVGKKGNNTIYPLQKSYQNKKRFQIDPTNLEHFERLLKEALSLDVIKDYVNNGSKSVSKQFSDIPYHTHVPLRVLIDFTSGFQVAYFRSLVNTTQINELPSASHLEKGEEVVPGFEKYSMAFNTIIKLVVVGIDEFNEFIKANYNCKLVLMISELGDPLQIEIQIHHGMSFRSLLTLNPHNDNTSCYHIRCFGFHQDRSVPIDTQENLAATLQDLFSVTFLESLSKHSSKLGPDAVYDETVCPPNIPYVMQRLLAFLGVRVPEQTIVKTHTSPPEYPSATLNGMLTSPPAPVENTTDNTLVLTEILQTVVACALDIEHFFDDRCGCHMTVVYDVNVFGDCDGGKPFSALNYDSDLTVCVKTNENIAVPLIAIDTSLADLNTIFPLKINLYYNGEQVIPSAGIVGAPINDLPTLENVLSGVLDADVYKQYMGLLLPIDNADNFTIAEIVNFVGETQHQKTRRSRRSIQVQQDILESVGLFAEFLTDYLASFDNVLRGETGYCLAVYEDEEEDSVTISVADSATFRTHKVSGAVPLLTFHGFCRRISGRPYISGIGCGKTKYVSNSVRSFDELESVLNIMFNTETVREIRLLHSNGKLLTDHAQCTTFYAIRTLMNVLCFGNEHGASNAPKRKSSIKPVNGLRYGIGKINPPNTPVDPNGSFTPCGKQETVAAILNNYWLVEYPVIVKEVIRLSLEYYDRDNPNMSVRIHTNYGVYNTVVNINDAVNNPWLVVKTLQYGLLDSLPLSIIPITDNVMLLFVAHTTTRIESLNAKHVHLDTLFGNIK